MSHWSDKRHFESKIQDVEQQKSVAVHSPFNWVKYFGHKVIKTYQSKLWDADKANTANQLFSRRLAAALELNFQSPEVVDDDLVAVR